MSAVSITFQSQAGFVPLCDAITLRPRSVAEHVSIPGGICSSLRRSHALAAYSCRIVSIPGGICSSLRLYVGSARISSAQSVSIPGGICSSLRLTSAVRGTVAGRFNPQAGFVPLCDLHTALSHCGICIMFQSQAGFVPLCDACRQSGATIRLMRFNPRRDLFLFATSPVDAHNSLDAGFNPRRDLFLFATAADCRRSCDGDSFNPRRDLFLFATAAIAANRRLAQCFNPRRDLFLFATRI